MTTAGTIDVEIQARLDKLDAGLRAGEAKVKAATERMEKSSNFPFGGKLVEGAARATAAMGTVELAVKGIDVAIQAMNGEWDKAATLVKQLPVIGGVAQGLEGVLGQLTGHNKAMEALAKDMEETNARIAKQMQLANIGERLDTEVKMGGLNEFDQQRLKVDVDFADALRQLEKLGASDELKGLAEERFEQQKQAIDRAETAQIEADKQREQRQQEIAKRQADLEAEQAKRKADMERQMKENTAARIANLDAQVKAAELRLQGKNEQARLVMLEASYDEQIRMAETAAERERLTRLKALEVGALERDAGSIARSDPGQFRQANIDRIALHDATTRGAPESDRKLDKANEFLATIARNTKSRVAHAA